MDVGREDWANMERSWEDVVVLLHLSQQHTNPTICLYMSNQTTLKLVSVCL